MPVTAFPHASVPYGTSENSTSLDECIRPALRHAYPVPLEGEHDARFRHLLDALALARQSDQAR